MEQNSQVLAVAAAGLGLGLGLACSGGCGGAAGADAAQVERCQNLKTKLTTDGFCVVKGAMPSSEIASLAATCHELLDAPENKKFLDDKFTGSLIPLSKHPDFAELIAHKATLGALAKLGFKRPRWLSGFIISKPPGGPSLGWHQDGWYWDEEVAYAEYPVQLFAMYYLTDTTRENGCLRVIPGSHLNEQRLHKILGAAHSTEVRENTGLAADFPLTLSVPIGRPLRQRLLSTHDRWCQGPLRLLQLHRSHQGPGAHGRAGLHRRRG